MDTKASLYASDAVCSNAIRAVRHRYIYRLPRAVHGAHAFSVSLARLNIRYNNTASFGKRKEKGGQGANASRAKTIMSSDKKEGENKGGFGYEETGFAPPLGIYATPASTSPLSMAAHPFGSPSTASALSPMNPFQNPLGNPLGSSSLMPLTQSPHPFDTSAAAPSAQSNVSPLSQTTHPFASPRLSPMQQTISNISPVQQSQHPFGAPAAAPVPASQIESLTPRKSPPKVVPLMSYSNTNASHPFASAPSLTVDEPSKSSSKLEYEEKGFATPAYDPFAMYAKTNPPKASSSNKSDAPAKETASSATPATSSVAAIEQAKPESDVSGANKDYEDKGFAPAYDPFAMYNKPNMPAAAPVSDTKPAPFSPQMSEKLFDAPMLSSPAVPAAPMYDPLAMFAPKVDLPWSSPASTSATIEALSKSEQPTGSPAVAVKPVSDLDAMLGLGGQAPSPALEISVPSPTKPAPQTAPSSSTDMLDSMLGLGASVSMPSAPVPVTSPIPQPAPPVDLLDAMLGLGAPPSEASGAAPLGEQAANNEPNEPAKPLTKLSSFSTPHAASQGATSTAAEVDYQKMRTGYNQAVARVRSILMHRGGYRKGKKIDGEAITREVFKKFGCNGELPSRNFREYMEIIDQQLFAEDDDFEMESVPADGEPAIPVSLNLQKYFIEKNMLLEMLTRQLDLSGNGAVSVKEMEIFLFPMDDEIGDDATEFGLTLYLTREAIIAAVGASSFTTSDTALRDAVGSHYKVHLERGNLVDSKGLRKVFQNVDVPNRGKLSAEEIGMLMQSIDTNGDEVISVKEFWQWLEPPSIQQEDVGTSKSLHRTAMLMQCC